MKVAVDIYEHEDRIVSEAKDRYGFKTKNDALNFIIRKFENHLQEMDQEEKMKKDKESAKNEDIESGNKEEMIDIFEDHENKGDMEKTVKRRRGRPKKKVKKLDEEKGKQNLDLLKNILRG